MYAVRVRVPPGGSWSYSQCQFSLSNMWILGIKLRSPVWQQAPLATQPSHWPLSSKRLLFFLPFFKDKFI